MKIRKRREKRVYVNAASNLPVPELVKILLFPKFLPPLTMKKKTFLLSREKKRGRRGP